MKNSAKLVRIAAKVKCDGNKDCEAFESLLNQTQTELDEFLMDLDTSSIGEKERKQMAKTHEDKLVVDLKKEVARKFKHNKCLVDSVKKVKTLAELYQFDVEHFSCKG